MNFSTFFSPSRAMDGVDLSKGVGQTADAFKNGSSMDKGMAAAKLGNTFLGFFPSFSLGSSIIGMHLNVADNMRNPTAGGVVDLAFDTAKIATSFHPVANVSVRGAELMKDSFVYCAQHPKEFAEFQRQTMYMDIGQY